MRLRDLVVRLGIDQATVSVLLYRLMQGMAGVGTLALIPIFLTSVEQGYYYTFGSVAAASMILEMGLSTVLVQVAGHEFARLGWKSLGQLQGDIVQRARFLLLVRKSTLWYGLASLGTILALFPLGILFFGVERGISLGYDWRAAWLLLIIATSISLFSVPFLAIVEGAGDVAQVYGARLLQITAGAVAVWLTLLCGGGIYAAAMMPLSNGLVALAWIASRRPKLFSSALLDRKLPNNGFSWRQEVWPMQWRLAVSWFCGYLLVQMPIPLLFHVQGAVVAGRMGLTTTVANMIGILAMSWMTSKTPLLARNAAERNWSALDKLFWRGWFEAGLAFLMGALVFLALRVMLADSHYNDRFLPVMETTGLFVAVLMSHMAGLFAVYLRAHKREPFMWASVVGAVLTVTGTLWVVTKWSSAGIIIVLIAVNSLFGLPVAVWLWRHLRRKWHV